MKKRTVMASKLVVLMLLCLPWPGARAYEVDTHATITNHAFQAALTQGNLGRSLTDLGLSVTTVLQDPTSTINIPSSLPPNAGIPLEWVREGSRHEDEVPRPLNHFFDPTHLLSGLCHGIVGAASSDWGLAAPGTLPNQQFSFKDARQYFSNGLTFATKQERDSNLAKMFRALGQVMHLIQDLANPQHVRDDAHNPDVVKQLLAKLFTCATSSPLYEGFIDDLNHLSPSLNYDGYPPPDFPTPQDFWETVDGRGLAQFTNLNFVSEGTNFNRLEDGATDGFPGLHPFPQLDLSRRSDVDIRDLLPGTTLSGFVTFYGGIVSDSLNPGYNSGTTANFRRTTHSIFDRDLLSKGSDPIFALNTFNYHDYARLLLPRAVGYSARLLNYFFRGSIDANLDANGNVIVKNLSNEDMENGRFTLLYDDANGVRNGVVSKTGLTIGSNKTGSLGSFTPPTSPPPKEPGKYILVFEGKMGQEDNAVVGKIVNLSSMRTLNVSFQVLNSPTSFYPDLGFSIISDDFSAISCFANYKGDISGGSICRAVFANGSVVKFSTSYMYGTSCSLPDDTVINFCFYFLPTFSGWIGDCQGTITTLWDNQLTMDNDKSCTAIFTWP